MRIIKGVPNAIRLIVAEMLNIESSAVVFINGEPVENPVQGYPRLVNGIIVDEIRASAGFVFVSNELFHDRTFMDKLVEAITTMEKLMPPSHLVKYHTIDHGYNTNVKVASRHKNTTTRGSQQAGRFITTDVTNSSHRFSWRVAPISRFLSEITDENIADAISQHVCSVFYDTDDICKLGHDDVTMEFSREMLKSYDYLVDAKMTLFGRGNPLQIELSKNFRSRQPMVRSSDFRNISQNKVYRCQYDKLSFVPTPNVAGQCGIDICAICNSPLWGENYAMHRSVIDPENMDCLSVCPICVHISPATTPLEDRYLYALKVKFPRTCQDMFEILEIPPVKQDVMFEALKSLTQREMTYDGRTMSIILIGEKYVAFEHADYFLFSNIMLEPELKGRLVCIAKFIK